MRPRLLDLFCGAGGAAMGYHQAGFDVIGVDINPQPRYPFEFIQADALEFMGLWLRGIAVLSVDAIHASPPCQRYSQAGRLHANSESHPDLIEPTREALRSAGIPYVMENVEGAPLDAGLMLCGTMFGLRIVKHRWFEASFPLFRMMPPCDHNDVYDPWHGKGRSADKLREAQETPWIPSSGGASRKRGATGDLNNAIPPAYTRFIGEQLLEQIRLERLAA